MAAEHPEKVDELGDRWLSEAKANNVLPLNDLQIIGAIPEPLRGQYTTSPGGCGSSAQVSAR